MVNDEEMHKTWIVGGDSSIVSQSYHPMIACFKQFISEKVLSELLIVSRCLSQWSQDLNVKSTVSFARILYVHLKAPARQQLHATKEEDIVFE